MNGLRHVRFSLIHDLEQLPVTNFPHKAHTQGRGHKSVWRLEFG